ncbi:MAG: hypothetical protein GC157_07410 [Frankiales bacterium]|nr:hypothetical protein [Frankiales bacterium]
MIASLRYEWVRIRTIRSTYILLALTFGLVAFLAWEIANPQDAGPGVDPADVQVFVPWYEAFSAPLTLATILASVAAAQSIGQEYRFGLIRLTLTAFPQRLQVLGAKLIVVVGAMVVFTGVSFLGSEVGVTLRGFPTPPEGTFAPEHSIVVLGAVFVVLWGLSAFAIAGITRQTALGIAVPIVSGLVVEQLLAVVLRDRADWLVRILPWSTATRWDVDPISSDSGGAAGSLGIDQLPVGWQALGVFGAWVLALLAVEAMAFLRRDA